MLARLRHPDLPPEIKALRRRAVDDLASFRMFTSQLCINGSATQPQIVRAFGVPLTTVKRMCAKLRREGAAAFFAPKPRREGSKLTDPNPSPTGPKVRWWPKCGNISSVTPTREASFAA
jgi:hypothetical protein